MPIKIPKPASARTPSKGPRPKVGTGFVEGTRLQTRDGVKYIVQPDGSWRRVREEGE